MRLHAVIACLLGIVIWIPIVTNGDPPPFPQAIELRATDEFGRVYKLVGGADVFAACAPDGTLRLSGYAIQPDGGQGHRVFAVDVSRGLMLERPEYRPSAVIRGSIFGQPFAECGITNVLSIVISDPNTGRVFLQRGN